MSSQIQMKMKMLHRWLRILNGTSATAIPQGIGRCYSKTELKGYYNDLTGKVGSGTLLGDDGIPVTQIAENEFVHFPIAIFQYGLGCYDRYLLSGRQDMAQSMIMTADWAVAEMKTKLLKAARDLASS